MVVLLGLNLLNIANGQAVILNTVAATVLTLALASKFIARQSSAPTEAAQDTRVQDATQARDHAAQALNAEAQAVVDRIRERTARSTTIVEENGVPTIKPKRPRK